VDNVFLIIMEKRGPRKGSSFSEAKPYSFGQKLFEIRRRKGLTQRELAQKIGSTVRAVSYYEREAKNPTMELLEKVSAALDVPAKAFVDGNAITVDKGAQTPDVIKSLRQILPQLPRLPRKKQESLVVVINGLLSEEL
jgi:transcriptional regulator with XRE-family HTH domain